MPTNEERREVAARLRELPIDLPAEISKWEEGGLFVEPRVYDEADYSQIHDVLLGCFPADHMHPCDYEELHNRLAELIEPEERTCAFRWAEGEMRCSACGEFVTQHDPDFEYYVTENTAKTWAHCPFCGAKVKE